MIIGIPKEIKNNEYRVAATPAMVRTLTEAGHRVLVETKAGLAVGYPDHIFKEAGAEIVDSHEKVWDAEMVVKVKEPQEKEYPLMR